MTNNNGEDVKKINARRGRIARETLNAIKILCAEKLQVTTFAYKLNINLRSAYRILEVFKEQHFPLKSIREGKKVYYWIEFNDVTKWIKPTKVASTNKKVVHYWDGYRRNDIRIMACGLIENCTSTQIPEDVTCKKCKDTLVWEFST